ncbi:MAG: hypothetical protein ACRD22_00525 [Terriglobia bacterium]
MSKFAKFVAKLRAEGYSKESARKIAAKAGDEKYGAEEMARRSAEARKEK